MILEFLSELTQARYRIFSVEDAHDVAQSIGIKQSSVNYILKSLVAKKAIQLSLFEQYCKRAQHHITRAMFELSLAQKHQRKDFAADTSKLLTADASWDFEKALEIVKREIVSRLPGEPWKGFKELAS